MDNITKNQLTIIDTLGVQGLTSVAWSEDRGVAAYARGTFGNMGTAPLPQVLNFLKEFGDVFGPTGFIEGLRHIRTRSDSLGWQHFEFQQTYQIASDPDTPNSAPPRPLDVYGGILIAHVDATTALVEIQSSCWRDVFVIPQPTIDGAELRSRLRSDFINAPGLGRLFDNRQLGDIDRLVMRGRPQLIVLPFEGGFRLSFLVHGPIPHQPDLSSSRVEFPTGKIFLDAISGDRLLERIYASNADVADNGSGLSQLPFGGPFANRPLHIVRVDNSDTYRLRDTTHSRDIITYDRGGVDPDYFDTGNLLTNGSITVSTDNDGDKNWDGVAANDTAAELAASQQPETDAHYQIGRVYEWYDALAGGGGREGWDDNNYAGNVPNNMAVHVLTHVNVFNAQYYLDEDDNSDWVSFLHVSDTISDNGHRAWGASSFVMCHEYQHGITAHSVAGDTPGFDTAPNEWPRAVTEGLSDVFGGLFSSLWYAGAEISPDGTIMRNFAFPRDEDTTSPPGLDHFDDHELPSPDFSAYEHGQILPHCAYLMSQGGVHQRAGRNPELIPVHGLGNEESQGLDVATAAIIWYRMMATRFGAVGPYDSEEVFRRIRTECVASAVDLYGEDSREHRNVIQAFYAVGLHPSDEVYGPDVTALRWGYSWRFSRPYIGLSSPDWASLDLFINNGGASEWNAIVNVAGSDTIFENNVYCRVRNVGDQTANNISVTFEYAKHGTAPVVWETMRDQDGIAQQLDIGSLTAGASNFDVDDQNNPPEEAGVVWHIPTLEDDEEVEHFCIRATLSSSNDVHPFNNTIQSNVAYTEMSAMMSRSFAFYIGNPTEDSLPIKLELDTRLPPAWQAEIRENLDGAILASNEERLVHLDLSRPAGPDFEPPFDGELRGDMWGELVGPFTGTLTTVSYTHPNLRGNFAGRIAGELVTGKFHGTIDLNRAKIRGDVVGRYQCSAGTRTVCVKIRACLRPERRIEIRQLFGGDALGGVTFQVQVPMPARCDWDLPPTDTCFRPGLLDETKEDEVCPQPGGREAKVKKLLYDCYGQFKGCVLDLCGACLHCHATEPAVEAVLLKAFRNRWTVSVELDAGDWIRGIVLVA